MTPEEIKQAVFDGLNNATENGDAEVLSWFLDTPVEEIAIDMSDKCADLEGVEIEQIVPFIEEWRRSMRT